jgi:beta-lactam-binding protein with PASTA domain/serine/threonine protein kinase
VGGTPSPGDPARLGGPGSSLTYTLVVDRTVSDPLVGQLLDGRYLVGDRIARGGMATVYEATDLRLDRLVALKVMPQALADDDTFRQRFVREARAAARLTDPNVVAVYDQGEHGDMLFLAMEYVPGRHTLRDVIRTDAPLSPTRALTILEEILKAIAAAHEAGIVHRDIKPENVLIDPRGQIKVADFGLARAISSATAATATGGVLMGTVSYLPPELVTDGSADARSDVYALGVLLFELLTGTKPHTGDTPIQVAYKHVHDDVPAPSSLVDGIPPYVDAFVARATSRQRDVRPADARVMLQQLRRVRHALDNGVIDDQELTDDLTPTVPVPAAAPGREEPAVPPGVLGDDVFDIAVYDDFPTAVTPMLASPPMPPVDERTLVVGAAQEPALGTPTPPAPARAGRPPVRSATGPLPPPPSRRRGWIALIVVLLLAAGAAAAGWWYGVGRFESTPDVVNMTRAAAEQKVESAGLSFEVGDVAYSENVAAGKIISTEPGPGENVIHDGTVTAVVSQGPERHDVPDLEGMTESEAIEAITGESLTPNVTKRRYDEAVAKGGVISWTPKAGTPLRRGDEVDLVVSRGPRPIPITDYTGQSADDAGSALSDLGLDVQLKQHYSDEVDEGIVMSQTPDHGRLFAGDEIVLVVSRGPHLVEVPDVYLSGVDEAQAALEDAGFEVDVQESDNYLGLGYVTSQDPDGGSMAQPGTTVTIFII